MIRNIMVNIGNNRLFDPTNFTLEAADAGGLGWPN
jgi:hypothetical protein